MTRVLMTGSRIWTNQDVIDHALVAVAEDFDGPFVLVHGSASGADTMAARKAHAIGWAVEPHPADWYTWGRAAGYIRNRYMVDLGADILLAFIKNASPGATMCKEIAERNGIPIRLYQE